MKKNFLAKAAFGLVCLSLTPGLVSLPTGSDVVSGSASISNPNPQEMVIEAGDRSIINYDSFSISEGESVRFIQPSSDATVLNRVSGKDASEILGKMQSNGRVMLVNPNGVYFGVNAEVSMGALVASTLDIANEDFSEGRYDFMMGEGSEDTEVVNAGSIKGTAGSVVLMGSRVRNTGEVVADAGSVVAAAGKKVTLDFVGNGLVNFTVEGELEAAVIEQLGSVEALQGKVHLAMSSVSKAIESVINTDGITMGGEIVEENGVILLVDSSSIKANDIALTATNGSRIKVAGDLDVSSAEDIGGSVHVFGEKISIESANINASGALGGGEVLVGGDYQGEGSNFKANTVSIAEDVLVKADALNEGSGGKVIVWSNGTTYFEGKIFARGGSTFGNGGLVETSGKVSLAVGSGRANTSAAFGDTGTWLLDPETITITSAGTDSLLGADDKYDFTSTLSINPDILNEATSNIVLSAMGRGGKITVEEDVSIVVPSGYELKFDVEMSSGLITLKNNSSVATEGGTITFNGPVLLDGDHMQVLATAAGGSGDINFSSTVNGSVFASDLTIDAGPNGRVNLLNAVGGSKPIGTLDVNAGSLFVANNITTRGQEINVTGATVLIGDAIIDTTVGGIYAGGTINFNGTSSTIDGPFKLFLETGAGIANMEGALGAKHPLESFKVTGARTILSQDMITDGNTMVYLSPVTLTADITLTDNGTSGIFFLDTVDGDGNGPWTLNADAPIGKVSFVGKVGGTNALKGLLVSGNTISQAASVALTNTLNNNATLTYSAPGGILVSGDIVTTVGDAHITMNNPVLFVIDPSNGETPANAGAVTITASSGSDTRPDPAAVILNGVTAGSGNLVVVTGTAGNLGSVNLQNSALNLVSLSVKADQIVQDSNSAIFATGNVTLDASAGTVLQDLTTGASISTTDGTILLKGGVLVSAVSSNLSAGTGNITLTPTTLKMSYSGNMKTEGGIVTVNSPGITLTGNSIINVGDGSAGLDVVDGAFTLTVSGSDVGSLAMNAAVGAVTDLTGLEVGIGSVLQASTVEVAGPVSYVSPLGIVINGASIATTGTSGTVMMIGPITLGANFAVTAAGAGADILFSGTSTTIASPGTARTLTVSPQSDGIVTFGGAAGTGDPLESIDVTAGAQVNVGSNITVSGAAGLVLTPPVVLTGPSTISATDGSGVVTFASTVNGTQPLNIQAGGVVTFTGAVGAVNYLAGLNVVGSTINVDGGVANVVGGATIFNGPVEIGANATFTNNGTGITFLSTVNGATFDLTTNSSTGIVHFGGAVGGGAGIASLTASALGVEVLGAVTPEDNGDVNLTGFNSILLSADITTALAGAITMNNPLSLGTTVTLTSVTGNVTLNGVDEGSGALVVSTGAVSLVSLGGAPYSPSSLSVTSSGAITQAAASPISTIGNLTLSGTVITTNASLSSSGGNISVTGSSSNSITSNIAASGGNVTLTGATTYNGGTISTGNGNFTAVNGITLATGATSINVGSGRATFTSTLLGAQDLSVNGTAIGTLTLNGIVGGTALLSLTAEIGNIIQASTVATVGPVTYSAASGVSLGGNITTTNATTGVIKIIGPTTLTGAVTLTTANPNILFEGSTSTINGGQTLSLVSGSGNIRLDGALGFNTALTSIATTSTGTTLIGSDINTAGTQTYGASSSTGNIVLTGDTAMNSSNNAIVFNGTINGNQSLLVNAGTSTVTYNGVIGAITPLQSLDTIGGAGISLSRNITAR